MSNATSAGQSGGFMGNLGKVYGFYTIGFAAFVAFLAILEQVGVPNQYIGYGFIFFTIAIYAGIGIISRTANVSEYYVAGRKVPAFYNGMATGSDWMSAASFIGMAGILYNQGYDGLAYILGWTGGFVLVAVLIGPYLRKFGCYTVPDFFSARYGGNLARFVAIIVLLATSFTYVTAQLVGTGLIAQRFLGMPFQYAVWVGLAGIIVCSLLGGMRAVTWTQVAQYIVLIVAYLIPVVILSGQKFGLPIPQLTYGQVLADITAREQEMVTQGLVAADKLKPYVQPFANMDPLNFFGLILCLMVGTASLPHVLMRYFTTPSVRDARKSVAWSLLFIFILYFTAPAYAAFAKLEVYQSVIGAQVTALPDWIYVWGKSNLVFVCGVPATAPDVVLAACQKIDPAYGALKLADFRMVNDAIVIATPEIAGLPYVISGLVAAGGLAAALSTADGLLLAIANALSHDIYYKMIDKNAPVERRMLVSRILLIGVAILAALYAQTNPADIGTLVAWAFSMAAAGFFPALVLGIWWKRINAAGAIAGMVVGFGITIYYMWGTRYNAMDFYQFWSFLSNAGEAAVKRMTDLQAAIPVAADAAKAAADAAAAATGDAVAAAKTAAETAAAASKKAVADLDTHMQTMANWWGIRNIASGLIGLPVAFIVTIVVSLITPAPSAQIQALVDSIRKPRGGTIMEEKAA
jgi:cation/acetate symporter